MAMQRHHDINGTMAGVCHTHGRCTCSSNQENGILLQSVAMQMGAASRYFSRVSRSGVDVVCSCSEKLWNEFALEVLPCNSSLTAVPFSPLSGGPEQHLWHPERKQQKRAFFLRKPLICLTPPSFSSSHLWQLNWPRDMSGASLSGAPLSLSLPLYVPLGGVGTDSEPATAAVESRTEKGTARTVPCPNRNATEPHWICGVCTFLRVGVILHILTQAACCCKQLGQLDIRSTTKR